MFCRYCGKDISDDSVVCEYCGKDLQSTGAKANDSANILWAVLSFFIPIVGLVLYLVWRTEKPETARVCGIGTLIGFGARIIVPILMVFLGMGTQCIPYYF